MEGLVGSFRAVPIEQKCQPRRRAIYFKERRLRQKEEREKAESRTMIITLLLPPPPITMRIRLPPASPLPSEKWNKALDLMERALQTVSSSKTYRFKKSWSWAFQMGWTTQRSTKMKSFPIPHNITGEKGLCCRGINPTHPLRKKAEEWQKDLFVIAKQMFQLIIPDFLEKQFVFHFGKMTSSSLPVPLHRDRKDISHQYVIHFGDWEGAELICYDAQVKNNAKKPNFKSSERRRLIKFDGRLYHEVKKYEHFTGTRFTIVCYQMWHEDKTKSDPLFHEPQFITPQI
jgi:hypothetical protein